MNLHKLVAAIDKFNARIDSCINSFRNITGIDCPPSCGKCCAYPDIQTTILEFVPMAYHLIKSGEFLDTYRQLSPDRTTCIMYDENINGRGYCRLYKERGFICRLFGYYIVRKGKQIHIPSCSSLRHIHKDLAENKLLSSLPEINKIWNEFRSIFPQLTKQKQHINRSIKLAIEYVYGY